MATIKSYTDTEQSKKLAEILPLENADVVLWGKDFKSVYADIHAQEFMKGLECRKMNYVPCWSLAALLSILDFPSLTQNKEDEWEVFVLDHKSDGYINVLADNPVDACYEMILKLNELKIL